MQRVSQRKSMRSCTGRGGHAVAVAVDRQEEEEEEEEQGWSSSFLSLLWRTTPS